MQHVLHPGTADLPGAAGAGDHRIGLRRRGAGVLAWIKSRLARPLMDDELNPALRSDIGVEDTPSGGPVLEVDGAVMRRLMSLR
ncbi:hypothetical protein DFH01_16970 [Falsiroseomonas bella]|uniref:Uncharacterized protein n=1 Tax=Falsiroseomonas bella TaxID=2184016 RepID=A0A317FBE0_9PROT|nr:hypothetical protein [Falsiroseomonas bella]PWS35327.1 hypothetical protein DFH01_16970 [Falsiroseomonas bella]